MDFSEASLVAEPEGTTPDYYKGNRLLPIIPLKILGDFSNNGVLPFILNAEKSHPKLIASTNPVRVENNVCFLVDLDKLQEPEDILSDDLGSWNQSKTAVKKYQLKTTGKNDFVTKITKQADYAEGGHSVFRRTFVNKSDASLRKTIVNVVRPEGSHHKLVFVRYYFEGAPEHRIHLNPHGSAKSGCAIPYLRTYKSTVSKMKTTVDKNRAGLKRVVQQIEDEVGGLQHCKSVGQLPRNERQVKYLKSECQPRKVEKDPIFQITEKMKEESQEGEKFIRAYSLDDESPKVILFTDEQLDDIANFCCNDIDGHNSILYVDVTFQLGPFFVLVTSYRNTSLHTKNANPPTCPVMLGPIMLCMLKDKATYITLFQKMTARIPGLKAYLQAYSTDGEKALREALGQEFERSVAFLCKIHVKQNIKDQCSKLKISKAVTNVVVDDIFGTEGLVHASKEAEYWKKLEELKQKWDNLEREDTRRDPRFSSYFTRHKADEIWYHVTAKVSRDAGFGDEVQCNNVSESGNAVMKRWQNFEAKDMSTFVDDVKELVDKQRSDVQRAFLGLHSPYIVREEYRDRVKSSEILDATPEERKLIMSSVKVLVDPTRYKQVLSYRTTPMRQSSLFEEEDDSGDNLSCIFESTVGADDGCANTGYISNLTEEPAKGGDACTVSGCLEDLLDTFTRKDVKALADKANKLQSEDAIREGFDSDTFFVKSTSTSKPHIVKRVLGSREGAGYSCDKECLGFVSRKLCAHTVAVAHYSNNLQQFVSWFKKSRRSRENLTSLTTFSVNKTAGKKKSNQQSRQRKKSPDVMTSMASCHDTLGDVIAQTNEDYTAITTSALRVTLRRNNPTKPSVDPTTSTPFELIEIKGKVHKCAGCGGQLKEGPDPYLVAELDQGLCLRHKEHDYVWIKTQNYWKKTFDNKHFHVYRNCLVGRNPSFNFESVRMSIPFTLNAAQLQFLQQRLNPCG